MRIGFFMDNSFYSDVDFFHPEKGNPGIRGTEYMIWEVACGLADGFAEVYLFATCVDTLPSSVTAVECRDEEEALDSAKRLGVEIMVLRSLGEKTEIFSWIDRSGIPCVMWSHNLETYRLANAIAECQYVKRNVCVSRQQYERLRDHPVFDKSAYIYNALYFNDIPQSSPLPSDKSNVVTYIGTLEAYKGFHALANVWREIREKVPDAELLVIDSGDRGKLIAAGDESLLTDYEKEIRHSLSDGNGELYPGVHFVGHQGGSAKEKSIMRTKVGISNPYGAEEFCITAIEFETYGVPVVAKKGFGLLDTVSDGKTGILVRNERELAGAVVRLLRDDSLCRKMGSRGMKYVRERFDMPLIIEEWKKLLTEVYEGIPAVPDYGVSYPFINYKWLRELSRLWKKTPLGKKSPSVMILENR